MRKLLSALFLLVGVLIGLGGLGHSFMGRLAVDAELGKFPIAPDVATMLYVVWYFVGGCMVLFGFTIVWAWYRQGLGEVSLLLVTALIGILYLAVGVGGFFYRRHDPFMLMFVLEGAVVLGAGLVLRRPASGRQASSVRPALSDARV
jgi:hypothetical protein